MALRAFHANPCIGGFGGESTPALRLVDHPRDDKSEPCQLSTDDHLDGDVFCQIVKELVDNAVDACTRDDENSSATKNKRVKVEIKPDDSAKDSSALQVIVSDNGRGMENIQNGVDAFQSSKNNSRTAGRYGIGLTLCLVHGQRLVPGSYACITSATKEARHFTRAWYVVNTEFDSVTCYKQEDILKTDATESGTCVGLLVPVSSCRSAAETLSQGFRPFSRQSKILDVSLVIRIMVATTFRGEPHDWPGHG